MIKYIDLNDGAPSVPFTAALGDFDGVHAGHRAVLEKAASLARKQGVASAAWYFSDSPKGGAPSLTDACEKRSQIAECGIDLALTESFSRVKDLSPEEFVAGYLVPLGCVGAVCGFNFRFGKGASGDAALLEKLCDKAGLAFSVVPPVMWEGEAVSSTRIREAVAAGDVSSAAKMLGRRFSVSGRVEHGRTLGRTLGFPTVNMEFAPGRARPRSGVYYTYTNIDGTLYPSVSNAGCRPTVGGRTVRLETHILGYTGDLYGRTLTVEFIEFRRPETAFGSISELEEAIMADRAAAEEFFEKEGSL